MLHHFSRFLDEKERCFAEGEGAAEPREPAASLGRKTKSRGSAEL